MPAGSVNIASSSVRLNASAGSGPGTRRPRRGARLLADLVPFCRDLYPGLERLRCGLAGEPVTVLGGYGFRTLLGGDAVADLSKATSTPTAVVIGPDGLIRDRDTSAEPSREETLRRVIRELLEAERPGSSRRGRPRPNPGPPSPLRLDGERGVELVEPGVGAAALGQVVSPPGIVAIPIGRRPTESLQGLGDGLVVTTVAQREPAQREARRRRVGVERRRALVCRAG